MCSYYCYRESAEELLEDESPIKLGEMHTHIHMHFYTHMQSSQVYCFWQYVLFYGDLYCLYCFMAICTACTVFWGICPVLLHFSKKNYLFCYF